MKVYMRNFHRKTSIEVLMRYWIKKKR